MIFWLQLGDLQNEKLILPRLTEDDRDALNRRIGEANIFPFIQLSRRKFELNLEKNEDRIVTHMLWQISYAENVGWAQQKEYE